MLLSASIVMSSRNEGILLSRTLASMMNAACEMPHEIIVVDDGSTDGSVSAVPFVGAAPVRTVRTPGLGVAPARNAGALLATGDMLVFCDAHISVCDGWLDAMARTLEEERSDAVTPGIGPLDPMDFIPLYKLAFSAPLSAVGCGRVFRTLIENTWLPMHTCPMECPILSGGCFAVRSDAWRHIGGYEDAFRGYGYDEEEISLKLWLFGYRLMTAPSAVILHKFRSAAPYRIVSEDMMFNRMYAALCHMGSERTERLLDTMRNLPGFESIRRTVFTEDNLKMKRETYRAARVYDDDWYFRKFSPHL